MIARIIRFSILNRVFVLLAALILAAWGVWAVKILRLMLYQIYLMCK